ncbi:branched-chain amino acid ABC transporter permease [Frankia sp. CcI49]|uniref:Branched-chain amino acid transport system permease protein n=1 Tax=Parafrankia irregularis TaxID=795642 RepID=A0A0S4QLE3_9ACTN|nr:MULTISPECIES: branched-chain amino acid ABC transporter permease [Frankiaceae]KPM56235.1 branched-chain amino acid ABC transporter permease [Frankia sp. R43]MBE3202093.1 branched-chain amino acid ABC transporter permease [Parafrankia sp. CH37]ONH62157.1 branched-chain amino acid ABC transporter permease [Frankia sp. CcI49]CUU55874.1 branched-chain amino acid transport system permease protein [Parafrankia irregularis]
MGSAEQISQLAVDGLMVGALYAVIALGYTLVYGVLQLINFAHSEVFMLGAFGGLFACRALVPGDGATPAGLAAAGLVLVGLVAGAAAGGAAAYTLERCAYRPLRRRGAPRLAYLISAIGASLFAFNLAGKEFGRQSVPVPDLFANRTVVTVLGAEISTQSLVIAATALLMLLAVDHLVAGTRLGLSIRAVAQDAECAGLMGVDVQRVIVVTFVLGGLLAGAGGFLYAMTFNASYTMGFVPGIKAFTAAVLGGIGNVRGAVLGGLLLGLVESFGGYLFDASYKNVIAFTVLVGVLLVRPSGLLGTRLGRPA